MIAVAAGCAHQPAGGPSAVLRDQEEGGKGSIIISLTAPEAENVVLVLMSAQDAVPATWQVRARRLMDGTWAADFDLIPGEYRYFFIVDGSLTVGPGRGQVVADDFGGETGVLNVVRDSGGGLSAF